MRCGAVCGVVQSTASEDCQCTDVKSLGAKMTDRFVEIARAYNRDDVRQRIAYLEAIYTSTYDIRNDPEALEFHATTACEVAILVRIQSQVDICTLAFPRQTPPLAASHPLMKALLWLEKFIEQIFKSVVTADVNRLDPDARLRRIAITARTQAAFIWKSYLLALNTEPANWGTDAVCALSALKILSTADSAKVINTIRLDGSLDEYKNEVRDDDWPPRGFINLYSKNSELLEGKLRMRAAMKQGDIEVIKQVARQNALIERRALDRAPRASLAENAERAVHLRSMGDLMNACKEMGREDFCDVVLAAIRAGNLSQQDTATGLFLREWVLSEANYRMPYPEWLAGEGRDRMVLLSNDWVHDCLHGVVDRGMPFHEWLAAPDNRRK